VDAPDPDLASKRRRTFPFDVGDRNELGPDHRAREHPHVQTLHGAGADDPDPHAVKDASSPRSR
jgi:hypothetical protein